MCGKDKERNALEKIKQILSELGEDSYVAIAMDGMIEDAEENIKNDFALSWKDRAQVAEKSLRELTETCNRQVREISQKAKGLSNELDEAKKRLDAAEQRAEQRSERVCELLSEQQQAANEICEKMAHISGLELRLKEKDDEIVRLKAKLYDTMVNQ